MTWAKQGSHQEARIAKMKDARMYLEHRLDHAVNLETATIAAVSLDGGGVVAIAEMLDGKDPWLTAVEVEVNEGWRTRMVSGAVR